MARPTFLGSLCFFCVFAHTGLAKLQTTAANDGKCDGAAKVPVSQHRMSDEGLDHDFYCPREFIPGRPGGFRAIASRQACCILDKSLAVMETIYLMRTCTRFQDKIKKWGSCFTGAVRSIQWHLRACCVDPLFFQDHTERRCMRAIHDPLRDIIQQFAPHFKLCTSEDVKEAKMMKQHKNKNFVGTPNKDHCHSTEAHAVRIIKRLHKAARELYGVCPIDLTPRTQGFLVIADADTLPKVEKLLAQNHGAPHDGSACDGC